MFKMMTLVDRQQTNPLVTLVYALLFVLIVVKKESSCIDFQGHPYTTDNFVDLKIDDPVACDPVKPGIVIQGKDKKLGNIVSPGYNKLSFEPLKDKFCSWTLIAPEGYKIWIEIDNSHLDRECHGSLSFYDEDQNLVESFCGWMKSSRKFLSPGNFLRVSFNRIITATQKVQPTFSFWYMFVKPPQACSLKNQFPCHHNQKDNLGPFAHLKRDCFTLDEKCNGIDDCGDGTDEENCPMNSSRSEINNKYCGKPEISPLARLRGWRIKGGKKSKPGSWPWQVAISLDKVGPMKAHVCGGTLINDEWILTAAHCILEGGGIKKDDYSIHLGKFNKILRNNDVEVIRYIKSLETHPSFQVIEDDNNDTMILNDIALIQLNAPVFESSRRYIRPICIPSDDFKVAENDAGTVTGWGDVQDTGYDLVLKQANIPIISNEVCKTFFSEIDGTVLCAGYKDGGDDTCVGDSGGPLMKYNPVEKHWQLLGIISTGSDICGAKMQPGIYTYVPAYYHWIRETIARHSSKDIENNRQDPMPEENDLDNEEK